MPNIYIVTHGSYSDYHIVSVHSNKEDADRRASVQQGDVEEFELDEPYPYPPGMKFFAVRMNRAGLSSASEETPGTEASYYYEFANWPGGDIGPHRAFFIWARDEAHAVKIANEKRLTMISENAFEN